MIDTELAAFLGDPITAPDPLACLDSIAPTAPASSKRTEYPNYPDPDGTAASLVKVILEDADAAERLKTNNKLLSELVTSHYFTLWHGRAEPQSSIRVESPDGAALVTFKKQVKKLSRAALGPVRPILGNHEKNLFRDTFEIKVDGDEIPAAAIAPLVTELKAVFAKHGASGALKVDRKYEPTPAFYASRHLLFSVADNLELNRTVPIICAVKTKDVQ